MTQKGATIAITVFYICGIERLTENETHRMSAWTGTGLPSLTITAESLAFGMNVKESHG